MPWSELSGFKLLPFCFHLPKVSLESGESETKCTFKLFFLLFISGQSPLYKMLLYILYQKKAPIEQSIKACNEWGSAAGKTIADVLDEQ